MRIRRARIEDKDQILRISKTIWDGHDYIPDVVDEWLTDMEGEFTVLEDEGEVRAFAKFTFLDTGYAWLEGIRVDSNFRNRGYANEITKYYIELAKKLNVNSVKFSTYYENYGSIKSGEKHGFQREKDYTFMTSTKINKFPKEKAFAIKCSDSALALKLIANSKEYDLSGGYIAEGWRFLKLHKGLLDNLCGQGRVLISNDKKALIIYRDNFGTPNINFYCGAESSLKEILNTLANNGEEMEIMLFNGSTLNPVLEEFGFALWEESQSPNVFLYNYPLS